MISNLWDWFPSKKEQEILELTHEVCREVVAPTRAAYDESCEFPETVINRFREVGLFKAMFAAEYDGLGLHPMMSFLMVEILGEYCLSIGTIFGAATVFAALPLRLGGTDEQKRKYLPQLASGRTLGAFAMTEPQAGSDILSLSTTAVKDGRHYVLNGMKKWITNAGYADLYTILAVTDKNKNPRAGLSCFIVEKNTPGLSFGKLENKLGLRCVPNCPILLEDVIVPEENLVGLTPNRGFALAFDCLTISRPMVAALGVGLATGAFKEASKYARQRKQFNHRLNEFQVVQHMLADQAIKIETARALTYKAGWYANVLNHPEASRLSAMAKYYAAEIAMQVATDALQLHGGNGFVKDYPIEKMFRDAKVLAIYEGTSQMMKSQVAASLVAQAGRLR